MIGTIYRIETAYGITIEGRVMGAGGMMGGGGPKHTPLVAEAGLRRLQLIASGRKTAEVPASEAELHTVRVFPRLTAESSGEWVPVELTGAKVSIVPFDTDDRPTLGWSQEHAAIAWRFYPRRMVETLKAGDYFFAASGEAFLYRRKDGALSGVHHIESLSGEKTCMGGRAEVILIP